MDRREWELTVRDYSPELVDQLKHRNGLDAVEVRDLTLEDIFKDYFRISTNTASLHKEEQSCLTN